jgi:hypothetical protein
MPGRSARPSNVLSKSALTTFDMCQQQAWYDIHERRPIIPNERMTFGSAVDAAVEQIVVMLRSGNPVEMARVMAAVDEVIAREDTGVDRDEVERAAEMFVPQVAVNYDWSYCRTQPSIDITLPDLGDINTHPDLILAGNLVRDVKTGKQAKPDEPTLELGFYGLCVEAETERAGPDGRLLHLGPGRPPLLADPRVPFTDELRRWTRERAGGYVRAKKADEVLNRKRVARRMTRPSIASSATWTPASWPSVSTTS